MVAVLRLFPRGVTSAALSGERARKSQKQKQTIFFVNLHENPNKHDLEKLRLIQIIVLIVQLLQFPTIKKINKKQEVKVPFSALNKHTNFITERFQVHACNISRLGLRQRPSKTPTFSVPFSLGCSQTEPKSNFNALWSAIRSREAAHVLIINDTRLTKALVVWPFNLLQMSQNLAFASYDNLPAPV